MPYNFKEGEVLLIDKELDWTSFDAVKKIKNITGERKLKVGHAGTLDPKATGLIIVCTGKKTKTINELMGQEKEYIAEIELGNTTPSLDRETEVHESLPIDHITEELVITTLQTFLGENEQIPPIFSAIKIGGKRLYTHARKGLTDEDIEIKPRTVNFIELEILDFKLPVVTVKIKCSKGTYIRSFARDFGKALSTCGYLVGLRRTKIGDYNVKDALSIESFKQIVSEQLEE